MKKKKIIIGLAIGILIFGISLIPGWEIVIRSPLVIRKTPNYLSPVPTNEEVDHLKQILDKIEEEKHSETKLYPNKDVEAKEPMTSDGIEDIIKYYANEYGVSEKLALCVASRESSFNPLAVGDSGKAVGLFQFWIGTWRMFRKQMSLPIDDLRTDPVESAKTALWAISKGYGSHWTAYRYCR